MKQENRVTRLFSGKKAFSLLLAVLLVLGCSIGATLAYLTATTNAVTNTFTVGKVSIKLDEHVYDSTTNTLKTAKADGTGETLVGAGNTNSYKLIPGKNMPKDPFVTVKADSEKCWLFVAVEEKNNKLEDAEIEPEVVQYSVPIGDNEWNSFVGDGYNFKDDVSVYYRVVDAATTDQNIYVLEPNGECDIEGHKNGCVTVNADVTNSTPTPSLTFTAAAIQYDGLEPATTGDDAELAAVIEAFKQLPSDFTSGIIKTSGGEAGE